MAPANFVEIGLRLACALLFALVAGTAHAAPRRPNILWITLEDISPNLGAYGDTYAVTPNMDRLAREGVRYEHAYAPIGVCAPTRSSIILGMYAPTAGTHNMRSRVPIPKSVKLYSQVLREHGYYTSNNVKEDYNLANRPADAWHDSSKAAHWRKRTDKQQPFFSIFNFTSCHESQIRVDEDEYQRRIATLPPHHVHDPALAPLPPYHPDQPEVRRDWARYADMITYTDAQVGKVMEELAADGLVDDTIVFLYSDHGAGMPRSKRWLYESSTRVPLIVRFGKNFQHLAPARAGSTSARLVELTDVGPTALSLAGIPVPSSMQGQPFLGAAARPPRQYVFGFRDRMDEWYDMQRAVRDERYRYIRNYRPELVYAQKLRYMYEMPTMRVWQRLFDAGKLVGPERAFFERKPAEELYDVRADPHEVHNLAADPQYRPVLERLRAALDGWIVDIRDTGFLPEAEMWARIGDGTPYELGRDRSRYDLPRILAAANLASGASARDVARLVKMLGDGDAAIRHWAVLGLANAGARSGAAALVRALADVSPSVRVAAAEAVMTLAPGSKRKALDVLGRALQDESEFVRLAAGNVVGRLGKQAQPLLPAARAALEREPEGTYPRRLLPQLIATLQSP